MLRGALALCAALLWCCGAVDPYPHPHPHSPPAEGRCAHLAHELLETARHAPAVIEARARSMSSDRQANLSVTFAVKRVLKSDPIMGRPLLEGEHVRVQVARGGCWGPPKAGRTYLLLAERAPAPPHLRLLAPPAPRSRHLTKRLRQVLRPRTGRPPGVVGLKPQKVSEGETVRMTCQARGRPPPTLAWFKNGHPIPATVNSHRRIRLQTKKRRTTLVISHSRPDDSGTYECRAVENGATPAASKATLTVRPHPTRNNGAPCPMLDPTAFCLNGGTCLFFEAVGEPACKCPDGFNGQRCENKDVSNQSSMYHSDMCKSGLTLSYYC